MKKFLLFTSVIALMFGACAEAAYYDEGNDGSSWETAYVIRTTDDMLTLKNRVGEGAEASGKYYVLDSDIDLTSEANWGGIGSTSGGTRAFTGHFDGQNHTVRINTTEGVFASVYNEANQTAIRNLNVAGNLTGEAAVSTASAVVNYLSSGIVDNCNFTGTMRVSAPTNAYSGRAIVGGIVGSIGADSSGYAATVRNCNFSGDIFVSSQVTVSSIMVGGIVGEIRAGTNNVCSVESCSVSKGTTITCNFYDSSGVVGGIVGRTNSRIISITNCTSYAVLEGNADKKGGIVGNGFPILSGNIWPSQYPENGYYYTTDTPVTNYYDRGNDGSSWENAYILESSEDLYIMRERVEAGSEDAGKYYKLSADIDFHVKNRPHIRGNYWGETFTGHLDGQNHTINLDTDESLFYVVSPDEGTVAVRNLHITGSVDGPFSNSGLAWRLNSGIIENCSFRGNISSSNSSSSGLVAQMRGGTILNCTVSADISNTYSNGSAGGIVGNLTLGTIESCSVQAGTVITSPQYAGGIAGYSNSSLYTGTIRNCNVEEGIVITSVYAGGILGYEDAVVTLSGNTYPSNYQAIGNRSANSVPEHNPVPEPDYYERGNDGSSWENAYVILSAADLVLMRDRINAGSDDAGKYYKLSADIDLTSASNWRGIGSGENFTGHFDGQDYTVTLNFRNDGLFNTISTDNDTIAVRNLNVAGSIGGNGGGLAWKLTSGIIENCSFTGTIGGNGYIMSGGLVEWMNGGIIRNCTVSADISSEGYDAGGIVASLSGGVIDNCTVEAGTTITASDDAGGIAGYVLGGTITNCTVEEGVSITGSRAGGIAGRSYSRATLSGNKWPSEYSELGSGSSSSGGGPTPNIPTTESDDNTPYAEPQLIWNKHTYQVFNENLTWEEAKTRCESIGGHLVTITSTIEQSHIENLLKMSRTDYQSYWIGASADVKGWWDWVTDEVFERQYANFAQGQPDGSGNYLCLYWNINGATLDSPIDTVSNSGKWDDTANNGSDTGIISHGFICEWDEEQEAIEEAPSAADFQRWQDNPDAWRGDPESGVPSGANPSPVDTSHLSQNLPNAEMVTLPVSYDARKKNSLPPVRNQGVFETCWAFASLGAMEADYMTKGFTSLGESPDLSELHLAWFTYKDPSSDSFVASKRFITDEGPSSFLMKGGDPDKAAAFLNKVTLSPVNESEMPYAEAGEVYSDADTKIIAFLNGRTAGSFRKANISLNDVNNIGSIYTNETEKMNSIKAQIMEHGSVYFRYGNDERGYNDDKTSFYYNNRGDRPHAALLVGWDDNYPASNFRQNPGVNGAWLVRTSRWDDEDTGEPVKVGDDEYGCFWMSYAQADTDSGITEIRSFSVREEKGNIQENGSSVHTKDITSAWGARIFRAGRNERLIRVSFHTTDNNVKYKVFVNRFGKKIPTDPGRAENPLSEGEFAYAGYHTIALDSPVDLYEGDYYAVIIKMTMFATSNYVYPTAVEASIDKYLEVSVNEGESFFAEGDEVPSVWQDGISVEGGPYNACIITFTEERITYDTEPTITTLSLPSATVNEYYTFTLSSSGTQKIEWRSGNIPEDFALSREGVLTGNPTKAGQYDINLTAVNDVGYVEKSLALTVNSAENTDNTLEPVNDTPANNTPSDNTPADDEPDDREVTRISSSGGGCNAGLCVRGAALLLLLTVKRKRG